MSMKQPMSYAPAIAGVLLAFSLAACSRNSQQTAREETRNTQSSTAPNKRAMVRFVNAQPDSGALDLWFGDQRVFSDVGFEKSTEYRGVPAERHEFKLRSSGMDTPNALATNSEGLSDGKLYTVVAMLKKGSSGGITLDILTDDTDNPTAGKAKVRVVNADADLGEIDLIRSGQQDGVIGGVNVDSASRYKEIDPSGDWEIRKSDTKRSATVVPEGVASGKNYTLIVMGSRDRKNKMSVDILRLEDGLVSVASNR